MRLFKKTGRSARWAIAKDEKAEFASPAFTPDGDYLIASKNPEDAATHYGAQAIGYGRVIVALKGGTLKIVKESGESRDDRRPPDAPVRPGRVWGTD